MLKDLTKDMVLHLLRADDLPHSMGRAGMMKGKVKRMGAFSGKRPQWKKAIVRLKEGQTIELFEQV